MFEENKRVSIIELNKKFEKIKDMNYIKGLHQGNKGNCGLTFENLIGKANDFIPLADFNGIEIKVKNKFGYRYITLFSLVPSNCFGIGLKRIRDLYGNYDPYFKNIKILNKSIYVNKTVKVNDEYFFKLQINNLKKRIILLVINKNGKVIDNNYYWEFIDIVKAIKRKLNCLALIKSDTKIIDNKEYFRYENITFYKFKGINEFFKLLREGDIRVYICLGVYRTGFKKGQIHDHGVTFGIKECDLLKLYETININK